MCSHCIYSELCNNWNKPIDIITDIISNKCNLNLFESCGIVSWNQYHYPALPWLRVPFDGVCVAGGGSQADLHAHYGGPAGVQSKGQPQRSDVLCFPALPCTGQSSAQLELPSTQSYPFMKRFCWLFIFVCMYVAISFLLLNLEESCERWCMLGFLWALGSTRPGLQPWMF